MRNGTIKEFQFEVYQRRFKQPLYTSHGVWQVREGIIISLTDQAGRVRQGEIAPLPWFGSETLSQALKFCQELGSVVSDNDIKCIPDNLPCCQFALESAWFNLSHDASNRQNQGLDFCYLLPAGNKALTSWQSSYQTLKVQTFKWKVGVLPIAQEIEILQQLDRILPAEIKLRLDANGGLSYDSAQQLFSVADTLSRIEFIEQPLSPGNLAGIFQLSQIYATAIALDESVASFRQLQEVHEQGWQGIYVIKAAIMGFPRRLIRFCAEQSIDIVFSSVFETEVARTTALNIAQELGHPRAAGFGVQLFC
ncbi:MAG: o-succinylbenzoate synthase [Cyanobacteria bacterium J06642_3]